jgi:hypothetical protein
MMQRVGPVHQMSLKGLFVFVAGFSRRAQGFFPFAVYVPRVNPVLVYATERHCATIFCNSTFTAAGFGRKIVAISRANVL